MGAWQYDRLGFKSTYNGSSSRVRRAFRAAENRKLLGVQTQEECSQSSVTRLEIPMKLITIFFRIRRLGKRYAATCPSRGCRREKSRVQTALFCGHEDSPSSSGRGIQGQSVWRTSRRRPASLMKELGNEWILTEKRTANPDR